MLQARSTGPFAAGAIDRRPERPTAPVQGIPEPSDFLTAFRRGQDVQTRVMNDGVRETQTNEALWTRHRELERAMGRALPLSQALVGQPTNERDSLKNVLERIIPADRINAAILGRPGVLTDDVYERRVEELRRENPDALEGIETRDQIAQRLAADWYAVRARVDEASGSGAVGAAGAFTGQVIGAFQDPVNASFALLTGGAGAGRPLLTRLLTQGALGAGQEALGAPDRMVDAARYGGPEYGTGEAVADILFGAVGAAGFEAAGDAARLATRPLRQAMGGHADPVVRAMAREIDTSSRAFARSEAVMADPAMRGALNRLEALERDEIIIGPADGQTFDAARAALDQFEPPPAVAPDRALSDLFAADPVEPGPQGMGSVEHQGRRVWFGGVDPARVAGDGTDLATDAAAGRPVLFEDAFGGLEGFGRRADPGDEAYLFRAADGWTAREVEIVSALDRLGREPDGLLSAARLLRQSPDLIEDRSLPVMGRAVDAARGLARLDAAVFARVEDGSLPPWQGALIGEMTLGRTDLQPTLADLMRQASPGSLDDARVLIREGVLADVLGAGDAAGLTVARARLRAAVLPSVRSDADLMTRLARQADALEVGAVLARRPDQARIAMDAAALALFDRMAMTSMRLDDAFGQIADAVAQGRRTMADGVDEAMGLLRQSADEAAAVRRFRDEALAPGQPSQATRQALEAFDEPGGRGQAGQIAPKPEDVALETDGAPAGLFDDLVIEDLEERAAARLARCAPGRG